MHLGQPPGLRGSNLGVRSDMTAMRTSLMPGAAAAAPGHAFTSLMPQPKPPSAAVGTTPTAGSLSLGPHDTRTLMQERERLSSLGGAAAAAFMSSSTTSLPPPHLLHSASTDAVLRDRLLTEQRDRMMLAAAAEFSARPARPPDALGPELFMSPSDNLLGSVGSALAAQSALLRPTLGACPPGMPAMKLPPSYPPIIDPALASLNLPFR